MSQWIRKKNGFTSMCHKIYIKIEDLKQKKNELVKCTLIEIHEKLMLYTCIQNTQIYCYFCCCCVLRLLVTSFHILYTPHFVRGCFFFFFDFILDVITCDAAREFSC